MPAFEEYAEEIRPVFESHILTNMGPVYKKFQHQLIDYLHVPYLSLFTNGHLALETALQALGLPKGGEVITTPFTFVSTTHAIVRQGLKPVFADIKPSDYTIDPDRIEGLVTDRTVAILPVHVYGHICDVERIDTIAKKHGLKVLYDAAHAFGEAYKGVPVGNFGDMTMFSFHATKVFNTVEGGAVAFHDERYRKPLHQLKNFGIENEESVAGIGGNAKLDELRSAMGIANLRHLGECIRKREKVSRFYDERLGNVPGLKTGIVPKEQTPNHAYYPVEIDPDAFGAGRDEVYEALKAEGIHGRKYFYPVVTEMKAYRERYAGSPVPAAKRASERIITLPIYPDLDEQILEKVCGIITRVRRGGKRP